MNAKYYVFNYSGVLAFNNYLFLIQMRKNAPFLLQIAPTILLPGLQIPNCIVESTALAVPLIPLLCFAIALMAFVAQKKLFSANYLQQ